MLCMLLELAACCLCGVMCVQEERDMNRGGCVERAAGLREGAVSACALGVQLP